MDAKSLIGEPLLTTAQAGEALGVNPRRLDYWRFVGRGPAYLKIEGAVRYKPSDLRDWLDAARRNARG